MAASPCKSTKRPFTVCIEGNIGSGKTTFLDHFKKFDNTSIIQEPVELWRNVAGSNLLEMMYKDPKKYAFLFQTYVQLTMLQLHTKTTMKPYKVMERSVYSARCFIENMKRNNILSVVESKVLEDWYQWSIVNAHIETDLIVYLRTTPEVVYQRMKARARKEENSVSLDYLKQVHEIHEDWLYKRTLFEIPAPVIILDANKDLDQMLIEFEKCKDKIFNNQIYNEMDIIKTFGSLSPCNIPKFAVE